MTVIGSELAAQTLSFLCGKFLTARLEVLPRHVRVVQIGSELAAQTLSFLWGKFSTARLEVLANSGVFQMSTMVNLGIGFQEPLTRPGVKLDEKMSTYSSDFGRSGGIYKFQLAGK